MIIFQQIESPYRSVNKQWGCLNILEYFNTQKPSILEGTSIFDS